ncbi:MAG TPA: peroxiredoxin [Bacteroidales bacterium]|nr:peroxiredoxin [Bacteroidales bacterium]HSA42241.1 peroxiredoxin [Bacteroidales bacterium]
MKKYVILSLLLGIFSINLIAQKAEQPGIPLIGEKAPAFTAESTRGTINFPGDYGSKWKVLFSHPADFTAVCSSELLELAQVQGDFSKLNTELIVISTDALETHRSWKESIETVKYKNRNPKPIQFPLVADEDRSVSRMYGMLHPGSGNTKNVRGVFIVDPSNIVRSVNFYPMEIGRNIDEIKRAIAALQVADREKVMTPANWNPGEDVMVKSPASAAEAEKVSNDPSSPMYKVSWYMLFKKLI